MTASSASDTLQRYEFHDLLIGGKWQPGSAGTTYQTLDPYTGRC